MIRSAVDYLEATEKQYPNKIAFADENCSLTFSDLKKEMKHIAYQIAKKQVRNMPVAVFLEKGARCISAYLGVTDSGNFYCPVDTEMPIERILKIIGKLEPPMIVTDREHKDAAMAFAGDCQLICIEDAFEETIDEKMIEDVSGAIVDTDLCYILFTSGSTGMPKGVTISHRSLVDFTEWAAECFGTGSDDIIANQTPLYFSMSIFDIYQTLRNGSTTYIVPHKLFSQPSRLMTYLMDHKVNVIDWVPSALCYVSVLKALNKPHVDSLKTVLFGGEVMPVKQLNKWIREYPDVKFVNIYGPTEVTDTCVYYVVDRELDDAEMLPIGKPCMNKAVFLLGEDNKLIDSNTVDSVGEICVRGSGLSYGYYNDEEKTRDVFVQNPLNKAYREIIYKTGDLGKYNTSGEMVYVSRKDFQIKHKGHRIELSEIETACSSLDEVEVNCCLYDNEKQRIVLFYVGSIDGKDLTDKLRTLLPEYMIPGKRIKLKSMPMNLNGKVDRQQLKNMMGED